MLNFYESVYYHASSEARQDMERLSPVFVDRLKEIALEMIKKDPDLTLRPVSREFNKNLNFIQPYLFKSSKLSPEMPET